jgi:hypothetical protein
MDIPGKGGSIGVWTAEIMGSLQASCVPSGIRLDY